jgi:hypothetical protein|tara:strand:+ start:1585 stop:1797 length:213 start_codon:yes stop_codon:yes gene_type:complete
MTAPVFSDEREKLHMFLQQILGFMVSEAGGCVTVTYEDFFNMSAGTLKMVYTDSDTIKLRWVPENEKYDA